MRETDLAGEHEGSSPERKRGQGELHKLLGDIQSAIACYEQALASDPKVGEDGS